MFDKSESGESSGEARVERRRLTPEDERIALRCNVKELQLLDSFVANGEYRSRSELMRAALREFLRARALHDSGPVAVPDSSGLVEVPVRLRPDEVEMLATYGQLVGNGKPVADVVAELARRGELEMKVSDLVLRHRQAAHQAAEARAQIGALRRSGEDLERKGVVGR